MVVVALLALQRAFGDPTDENIFLEFEPAPFTAGFHLQKIEDSQLKRSEKTGELT